MWSAPFEVAPTAMGPGINQSIDVMHDEQDRPIVVFDAIANGTRHLFAAVCH